jgi:hypothetical protein
MSTAPPDHNSTSEALGRIEAAVTESLKAATTNGQGIRCVLCGEPLADLKAVAFVIEHPDLKACGSAILACACAGRPADASAAHEVVHRAVARFNRAARTGNPMAFVAVIAPVSASPLQPGSRLRPNKNDRGVLWDLSRAR